MVENGELNQTENRDRPQDPPEQCDHRSFWRRKAAAPKQGFIFTNYPQLIKLKQNQSERIHLSNYIQVKLWGAGSRKVRDESLKAGFLCWKPV